MDLKPNVSMDTLTTLKIGGPAKEFVEVKTDEELSAAIKYAKENNLNFLVIGGGSNLLVSDQGFEGLVIKNEISGIEKSGQTLKVKSGTQLQELVDYTISHSLAGLNKLTGIPGTVGGAVYGNAGAFGQTISDCVKEVICLNPSSQNDVQSHTILSKQECEFDYRDSGFKRNGYIILEVYFTLPPADKTTLQKEAKEVLEKRLKKYPPGILCPGSFFKNLILNKLPEDIQKLIPKDRDYFGKVPAWYFLDEVGAKGDQLGNIKIADFHGNLFINLGGGTAKDFYTLAKIYFDKVKEKFGISLEPEVQLINLPKFS